MQFDFLCSRTLSPRSPLWPKRRVVPFQRNLLPGGIWNFLGPLLPSLFRIAEKSGRNLRRAILMVNICSAWTHKMTILKSTINLNCEQAEACKVAQYPFSATQPIQDLDWEVQGDFFNWASPENVSRLAPPKMPQLAPPTLKKIQSMATERGEIPNT